jgi:heme/copper-type cytochrome/quinol oxidase subunit 2
MRTFWLAVSLVLVAVSLASPLGDAARPQGSAAARAQERGAQQAFVVVARKYAFEPARLEVQQDDVVKVTFRADDIAHSFTIDAYRIAKRAGAGQTVTFEFRADRPGTFPFYCDLRADDGCRKMRGTLVVRPR